ncbi:MAG: hypothetical protein WAK69_05310 [Rhodoplanes sp.]
MGDITVPRTVFGRVSVCSATPPSWFALTRRAQRPRPRDATVLATALKRARQNVDAGLASFEEMQLEYGPHLVRYGIALGQRWAAKAR